jgi:hypothetical protein
MKSQSWERSWRRIALSLGACIGLSSVAFVTTVQSQNSAAYNQTVLTTLSKISASGASGQFDTAEQLFRDGKEAGLSELQMYETVLNLLPYIGYPRTLSTLGRFQKVYPNYIVKRSEGESPKPTEPWQEYATTTWGKRGMQVQEQLAGGSEANKELIQRLSQISPELAEWVRYDDFGRVFGTLIALGAPQISFHYKAMLRVGGDDALVDALLDGVAGIANEKALTAARQHIDAARK